LDPSYHFSPQKKKPIYIFDFIFVVASFTSIKVLIVTIWLKVLSGVIFVHGISTKHEAFEIWRSGLSHIYISIFLLTTGLLFFGAFHFSNDWRYIFSPRMAYQYGRLGNGHLYIPFLVLCSWGFGVLGLSGFYFIAGLGVFCITFLSGSKGLILSSLVWIVFLAVLKASRDQKISSTSILFVLILLGCAPLAVVVNFGVGFLGEEFLSAFSRYFGYASFVDQFYTELDFMEFEFFVGDMTNSQMWQMVPRSLFEAKPFAHGSALLVEYYYPGLATTGHTPSFGMYSLNLADYGLFAHPSAIFASDFLLSLVVLTMLVRSTYFSRWIVCALICYCVISSTKFLILPGLGLVLSLVIGFFCQIVDRKLRDVLNETID
jgi:hypothetical protein